MTKPPALRVSLVPIDDIRPADYNPRKIAPKMAARLQASLERFGLVDPLLINKRSGRLISGHQRLEAARSLNWSHIPVAYVDLDDDDEKVLNIALNALVGEWDVPKLTEVLDTLPVEARELAGFDLEDLALVRLHYRRTGKHNSDRDRFGRDNVPTPPANPVTKPGDVWKVGPHLVICGDSTDPALWARYPEPNLVVTSPPYPGARMWDLPDDELAAQMGRLTELSDTVLEHALAAAAVVCWNIADVPIGANKIAQNTSHVRTLLESREIPYREIVWDKGIPILPPVAISRRPVINSITHELVFVATHRPILVIYPEGWTPRKKRSGLADGQDEWQLRSVWNISPAKRSEIGHSAAFPVELAERCIYLYSLAGDVVLDPFGGAGSTLIAAENATRTAILFEIEPGWVDLILERAKVAFDFEPALAENIA